jgi:hypothetical protein
MPSSDISNLLATLDEKKPLDPKPPLVFSSAAGDEYTLILAPLTIGLFTTFGVLTAKYLYTTRYA